MPSIYTTISIQRDGQRSAGFRHSGRDDAETMIKAIRQHADNLRAELALIDSAHDAEFRIVMR